MQPSVGAMLGVAVHFTHYEYLAKPEAETSTDAFNRISSLHPNPEKERTEARLPISGEAASLDVTDCY